MLDGSALPLLFCGAVAAGIALVQWELMKAKQKAAMPKRIVLIRHGNIYWYYNKWVVLLPPTFMLTCTSSDTVDDGTTPCAGESMGNFTTKDKAVRDYVCLRRTSIRLVHGVRACVCGSSVLAAA